MAMQGQPTALESAIAETSELRDYWVLLKPKVMSLVVFSGAVGLYLAPGSLHPLLALTALLCIAVGAAACAAINNGYDQDIDRLMPRTARRPTATGRIAPDDAQALGVTLAIMSVMVMGLGVNWVAASLLALTIGFYVFVYTMLLKRRTPQNIVIGGAAGALPPMVGWAAVTGDIGIPSLVLFAIIFMWTPPHFWALSLYRSRDYSLAGVPMLPVVAGLETTRTHILAYTLVLVPLSLLPVALGFAGLVYGLIAAAFGVGFVTLAVRLWRDRSQRTATRTFRFSILYLFAILAGLVVDRVLSQAGLELPGGAIW
jgi:protoheme IX farnesyltransferase